MTRGARLPGLAECRDCHEPIRFVRMTATGRNMPVNPAPIHDAVDRRPGQVAAILYDAARELRGHVTTPTDPGTAYPHRFTPHYATCTAQHRPTPTPQPADPALF